MIPEDGKRMRFSEEDEISGGGPNFQWGTKFPGHRGREFRRRMRIPEEEENSGGGDEFRRRTRIPEEDENSGGG